jgi:polyisoprenyl-phosphate glycosyltransferase
MTSKRICVVLPVFNEEESLMELWRRLRAVFENLDFEFLPIFVDDGSEEPTQLLLDSLAKANSEITVLHFSRNFGHQAALSAGLDEAIAQEADAVITMDSDLQHPPARIPELLSLWQAGYEVVYTIREDKGRTGGFKRITASIFYRVLDAMSDRHIPRGAADFRLLDRVALQALATLPERARFLRGLTNWIGFRQIGLHYEPDPRFAGTPKYDLRRMFRLAMDGVVSMTTFPLRVVLLLGLLVSGVSLLYLAYIVLAHFISNRAVPGWSSVMVSVLFLGGMNLTVLGVIGIYLAKVFDEVKARPQYLIRTRKSCRTSVEQP